MPSALLTLLLFSATTPPQNPGLELESFVRRFDTDNESLQSFYDLRMSENGLKRREVFLSDWQKDLGKADFGRLSQEGKVDYLLLKTHLDHELSQVNFRRKRDAETAALAPFASTIDNLEETRWRVEPVDPEKAA